MQIFQYRKDEPVQKLFLIFLCSRYVSFPRAFTIPIEAYLEEKYF